MENALSKVYGDDFRPGVDVETINKKRNAYLWVIVFGLVLTVGAIFLKRFALHAMLG